MFFGPIRKTTWPSWPLIGWDIFNFSSETTERNLTKLDREQHQNPLPSLCFWDDRKNKMTALACDWLMHFGLLLWNRLTEIKKKLDRKVDLNVLCKVYVFRADRKIKTAAPASYWMRHVPLLWNRWTEYNETWQEARSQRLLPSLFFSGRSEKTRWPPWCLIGWDTFNFSSETTERNSTKLDRKLDLNVLYHVVFFGPIGKTRWPLIG